MAKWILPALVVLFAGVIVYTSIAGGGAAAINVVGSTSVQPFAEMLAQEFNRHNPDCTVDVQGGGSTAGLQAAENGVADIGMCSRALKDAEKGTFQSFTIARDGLAVVVHPSNPVEGLTRDQLRRLFTGEITNWKDVGGPDRPVRLITREEGSGTREAFVKLVMEAKEHKPLPPAHSPEGIGGPEKTGDPPPLASPVKGEEKGVAASSPAKVAAHASPAPRISRKALTQESSGAVKELVRHDPCAVGYMSLGLVRGELRMLKVDGAEPTAEAVQAGRYPLVRPFLFVSKGPPVEKARRFIDFVLSPEAQKTLAAPEQGLIPAR